MDKKWHFTLYTRIVNSVHRFYQRYLMPLIFYIMLLGNLVITLVDRSRSDVEGLEMNAASSSPNWIEPALVLMNILLETKLIAYFTSLVDHLDRLACLFSITGKSQLTRQLREEKEATHENKAQ